MVEASDRLRSRPRHANPVLLAVALLLLLGTLRGDTFNCSDEQFTAAARHAYGNVWSAARSVATGQGRFYHLFVFSLAQVPFLPEKFWFLNACRMLSTGLVFLVLFLTVRRLFGSAFGYFATFGLLGLVNTRYDYNPFHSLPFWFNTGLMVFFLSMYCFSAPGVRVRRLAPYLFFLACLFYEVFLPYVIVFPLLWLYVNRNGEEPLTRRIGPMLAAMRGFAAASLLYLLCWAAFRLLFPTKYAGTHFSLGPVGQMLRTVFVFSSAGLLKAPHRPLLGAGWEVVALAVVCGAGFALNFRDVLRARVLTGRALVRVTAISVVLGLLPNVLYAFTERYREWVVRRPYYVGSFYSAFFLIVAICAILSALRVPDPRRPGWRLAYAVIVAYFTLTAYTNHVGGQEYREHSRSKRIRWQAADALVADRQARQGAIRNLYTNFLIRQPDPYRYWDYYLSSRIGQKVEVQFAARPVRDNWNLFADARGAPTLFYLQGDQPRMASRLAD